MGENEEAPQAPPPPLEWESVPADKKEIRERIWNYIEKHDLANFPRPVTDRNPNFKGADVAAEKINELKIFESANIVRVNQDKPQEGVRYQTMLKEKELLVQTPRQKNGLFYKILPPTRSDEDLKKCATQRGVKYHRENVTLEDNVKIDVIVSGSVAVSKKGYRLGKGRGYEDLEYAMMRSIGAVDERTPIITVVHDCQIVDIPDEIMEDHDVDVDYILTPTQLIQCEGGRSKPKGLMWSKLTRRQLRMLPILRKLQNIEKEAGVDVTLKFIPRTQRPKLKREEEEHDEDAGESPPPRRGRGGRRGQRGREFGRRGRNFGRSRRRQQSEQSGDEIKENHEKNEDSHEHEEEEESRPRYGGRGRGRGRGRGGRGRGRYRGRGGRYGGRYNGGFNAYRGKRDLDPAVYVGGIGEEVRVSSFKNVVRETGVSPVQVIWRGKKGYAFLVFKDLDTAKGALVDLQEIKHDGCDFSIKLSNKFVSEEASEEVSEVQEQA